jgi:hypothetical protein
MFKSTRISASVVGCRFARRTGGGGGGSGASTASSSSGVDTVEALASGEVENEEGEEEKVCR